jgi:uncharacterized membrane protein YgcG
MVAEVEVGKQIQNLQHSRIEPVPPKSSAKAPQPVAYAQTNDATTPVANVVQSAARIAQARKAKNLKEFTSDLDARAWLANFVRICATNKLERDERLALFLECLSDKPRRLFNSKFDGKVVTIDGASQWLTETYPSVNNRLTTQWQIDACTWDLRRPFKEFLAEFNECFIDHPTCDDLTRISTMISKLPPTMQAKATDMPERWTEFNVLSQWIINVEHLKKLDMPDPHATMPTPRLIAQAKVAPAPPVHVVHEPQTYPYGDAVYGYFPGSVPPPPTTHAPMQIDAGNDYPMMLNVLRSAGVCFNCGKPGHIAKNCRAPRPNGHSNQGGRGGHSGRGGQGGRGGWRGGQSGRGGGSAKGALGKRKRDDAYERDDA